MTTPRRPATSGWYARDDDATVATTRLNSLICSGGSVTAEQEGEEEKEGDEGDNERNATTMMKLDRSDKV